VDFHESDEQRQLRDATRRLLEARSPLSAVRTLSDSDRGHDEDVWRRGADLGWSVLAVPEDIGGAGGTLTDLTVVAEEHGRMVHPGPLVPTALVAHAVSRLGTPEQQAAVLGSIGKGTATGAWAVVEPGGGWALDGLKARAEKSASGYALHGVKTAVAGAGAAQWVLVTAVLDDRPALFLLDTTVVPLTMRRLQTLDITRRFDEVQLEGVELEPAALLSQADDSTRRRCSRVPTR
jgi:alkylation response protein AidB-like acyl-CoA dehydrogenase